MTILRRLLASVFFVLGAVALALWAVAALTVKTVEDGSVVTGIAQKVIDTPAAQALITDKSQALVTATLTANGVDMEKLGLQGTLDDVVAKAVSSTQFQDALANAIDAARANFADQLTSPASEGKPLTLKVDISAAINSTIESAPGLSGVVPAVSLSPLTYDITDANSFGKIRGLYGWIHRIAAWAGWIGLALIAIGIVLVPRKRWLIPLGLLWVGLAAGAVWAALQWLTVERIADRLPGGADGEVGNALTRSANQATLDGIANKALVIAVVCLIGAVAAYIVVKIVFGSSKNKGDDRPRGHRDAHSPEHAR